RRAPRCSGRHSHSSYFAVIVGRRTAMNIRLNRNLALIYAAAFLRSASIGLLGVVLAVYLSRTGFSATAIGFVLAAGLAGSAAATAATSRYGERFGRRRVLVAAALLSSLGGIGLAFVHRPSALI